MPKLIIGCGYLGRRVAERWLAAGHAVAAVTRSRKRAERLEREGLQPIVADVTRPETLDQLPLVETVLCSVGYDRGSGKSRWEVCVAGFRAVLDALPAATAKMIYLSSTGVYGQTDGSWVDEDSPCRPTREAGRVLLAAEELLAGHTLGRRTIVLRLAGLYGPGRLPRKADLMAGKPIAVATRGYVNLIHVDDAAAVVASAEARARPPRTYVVSDGHPTDRRTFYTWLAELLAAPQPQFVEPSPEALAAHHAGSNKRANNGRMLAELGVQLKHPTYKEGLAAIVAAEM